MKLFPRLIYRLWSRAIDKNLFCLIESVLFLFWNECKCRACIITGAQPKAGTGLKMQTVRFFNVTLLGIYR